jgi:hypothetical protein
MDNNDPFELGEDGVELLGNWVPPGDGVMITHGQGAPESLPGEIAKKLNWFMDSGRREIGRSKRAAFYPMLQRLVDQWIDSGRKGTVDEPYVEEPYKRNVIWSSRTAYPEPISKIQHEFLERHPARQVIGVDGRITYKRSASLYRKEFLDLQARDEAISLFLELLESETRSLFFRCGGCQHYFVHSRAPRQKIQHGSFCEECKDSGKASVVRTEATRKGRGSELVALAADWSSRWDAKKHGMSHSKWVADMMKRNLPVWRDDISGNWVTRHREEIATEVERRRHAKG